jgi:hypothetical protein
MSVVGSVLALPEAAGAISDEGAVARIVSRLSAEYVLSCFQLLIDTYGDIRSGLLVTAINTANVAHIDFHADEGRRAAASDGLVYDDARRPVGVASLAVATGLPLPATRRIVQRLIDAGDCVGVDGGVIVPRAVFERPETVRLAEANVRNASDFVRRLLARGLVEEAPAVTPSSHATVGGGAMFRAVIRQSAEYGLRAFRLLVATYGDIQAGIVAQAIVNANTAHLDAPMGDGWRYAGIDQPPPDEVRRPISVSGLAKSLGLPYETLRRQVRRLVEAGVCVHVEGGLIIPMAVVEQPATASALLANVRYVRAFVRNLWALGFDPYEN